MMAVLSNMLVTMMFISTAVSAADISPVQTIMPADRMTYDEQGEVNMNQPEAILPEDDSAIQDDADSLSLQPE